MRKSQLNKIKNKKTNEKFSDFELEELVSEIKEYKNLLNSIGYKIKGKDIKFKKRRDRGIVSGKDQEEKNKEI